MLLPHSLCLAPSPRLSVLMLMPGKGFVSLTMPRGAQIWPEMPGSDNSLLPLSGIGPGSGRYGASERDFWLGPGSGWVIHNLASQYGEWRDPGGWGVRGWHQLWSIQRGLRSNSGGGRETMDVSILRNKLTLELMSHAMAAICFNLYPNGVNSSHLTTLNGSLPPTLFPSVNIYRYSDSLLLCYVENDGDCPKI